MTLSSTLVSALAWFLMAPPDPAGRAMPAVSVVADADFDCPTVGSVERALAELRGRDAPLAARDPSPWTLTLSHSPGGVRVDLRDVAGVTLLARDVVVTTSHCDSAAEAIAIIIERFFRDVAWTAEIPPRAAPAAPAAPKVPVGPRPAPPAPAPVATAPAVASAPSPRGPPVVVPVRRFFSPAPRLVVGAGPGFWTRAGGSLSLLLDARLRLATLMSIGLGVWLPLVRSDESVGNAQGRAQVSGVPVSVRVAAAGQRGRLTVALGVEALLTFEKGQSLDIAAPATARRTVLAAGLGLGAAYAVGPRLRVAVDVAGYRALLGPSFTIGGVSGPVLEPPAWQGILALRLEWIARR